MRNLSIKGIITENERGILKHMVVRDAASRRGEDVPAKVLTRGADYTQ